VISLRGMGSEKDIASVANLVKYIGQACHN